MAYFALLLAAYAAIASTVVGQPWAYPSFGGVSTNTKIYANGNLNGAPGGAGGKAEGGKGGNGGNGGQQTIISAQTQKISAPAAVGDYRAPYAKEYMPWKALEARPYELTTGANWYGYPLPPLSIPYGTIDAPFYAADALPPAPSLVQHYAPYDVQVAGAMPMYLTDWDLTMRPNGKYQLPVERRPPPLMADISVLPQFDAVAPNVNVYAQWDTVQPYDLYNLQPYDLYNLQPYDLYNPVYVDYEHGFRPYTPAFAEYYDIPLRHINATRPPSFNANEFGNDKRMDVKSLEYAERIRQQQLSLSKAENFRQQQLSKLNAQQQLSLSKAENFRNQQISKLNAQQQLSLSKAENFRNQQLSKANEQQQLSLSKAENFRNQQLSKANEQQQLSLSKAENFRNQMLSKANTESIIQQQLSLSKAENIRNQQLSKANAESIRQHLLSLSKIKAENIRKLKKLQLSKAKLDYYKNKIFSNRHNKNIIKPVSNGKDENIRRTTLSPILSTVSTASSDTINEATVSAVITDNINKATVPAAITNNINEATVSAAITDNIDEATVSAVITDNINEATVLAAITNNINEATVSEVITDNINEATVPETINDNINEATVPAVSNDNQYSTTFNYHSDAVVAPKISDAKVDNSHKSELIDTYIRNSNTVLGGESAHNKVNHYGKPWRSKFNAGGYRIGGGASSPTITHTFISSEEITELEYSYDKTTEGEEKHFYRSPLLRRVVNQTQPPAARGEHGGKPASLAGWTKLDNENAYNKIAEKIKNKKNKYKNVGGRNKAGTAARPRVPHVKVGPTKKIVATPTATVSVSDVQSPRTTVSPLP